MLKVSAGELQKNFGLYQDRALVEPIAVTRYGRESVVLLSAREFHRLKKLDREVLAVEELPEEVVEAIARAEVPEEHARLDEELR
jgi:prevent-host-death family protein